MSEQVATPEPVDTPPPIAAGDEPPAPAAAPAPEPTDAPPPKGGKKADPKPAAPSPTLADGGEAVQTPVPQDFPDNWAELLADGNKKLQKELERLGSVKGVAEAWKNANDKIRSGGVVTVPGADATDEERAEFFKAIGVPETPEGYAEKLQLSNNRVLGDDDRPAFEKFAKAMHARGATPDVVSAATDVYFDLQQEAHEAQAEDDAQFRVQSEVALKSELGGDYKQRVNAIAQMFTGQEEVRDLLLNGRTADGRKFGDHPDVVKFLAGLALDLNPSGGLTPVDGSTVTAMEQELGELRAMMKDQTSEYWEGPRAKQLQARFNELLGMKERIDARKG